MMSGLRLLSVVGSVAFAVACTLTHDTGALSSEHGVAAPDAGAEAAPACGALYEPCCDGYRCDAGACAGDGLCRCGALGLPCCTDADGGVCNEGACVKGTCRCGQNGSPCCASGVTCTGSKTKCCTCGSDPTSCTCRDDYLVGGACKLCYAACSDGTTGCIDTSTYDTTYNCDAAAKAFCKQKMCDPVTKKPACCSSDCSKSDVSGWYPTCPPA